MNFQIQSAVTSSYLTSAPIEDLSQVATTLFSRSNKLFHPLSLSIFHSHFLSFTPPSPQLAESAHEANLATALYLLIFAQQIINPCVFLYSEFRTK